MSKSSKRNAKPLRSDVRMISSDPILPVRIEHGCDEIWFGDTVSHNYNFLDYTFEDDRARLRARAYAGSTEAVTVYPAYLINSDPSLPIEIEAAELRAAAVAYLRRRYRRLEPDDPKPKMGARRPN